MNTRTSRRDTHTHTLTHIQPEDPDSQWSFKDTTLRGWKRDTATEKPKKRTNVLLQPFHMG